MRHLLIGMTLAAAVASIVSPAGAQAPSPTTPQWQPPPYNSSGYQSYWYWYWLNAPTPADAYRQGTINRWQFEQLAGPLPAALQGPSVDGTRGDSGGGGGRN
jgi:hypothetical protein